jgi:hypothetical protein
MGPAWQASSTRPGHNALLPDHCLLVDANRTPLTSPALSTNSYLHSPTLQKTLATTPCEPYSAVPGASAILPSEPGPIRHPPAMTPPADQPDVAAEMGFNNDMNVIVGGALQPSPDQQNPQRLVAKAGPGLRLPSFEAMGIASPRPEYFPPISDGAIAGAARDRALSFGSLSHSHPGRVEIAPFQTPDIGVAPGLDRTQSPKACLQPQQNPVHQYVATLTPPAETGDPSWRPSIMTAVMDSPNIESPAAPLPSQSEPSSQSISAASDAMQNVTISEPATTGERAWLEGAVQALRESCAASRILCEQSTNISCSLESQNITNTKPTLEGSITRTSQSFTYGPRIYQHHRSHSRLDTLKSDYVDKLIPRHTRSIQPRGTPYVSPEHSWSANWRRRLFHTENLWERSPNHRLSTRLVIITSLTKTCGPTEFDRRFHRRALHPTV